MLLAAFALFPNGCISDRGDICRTNSDCASGFCSASGFCDRECKDDRDCVCGSYCGASCGLCLRDDGAGPATCYALRRGLSTQDVLGACRVSPPAPTDTGGASGEGDATTTGGAATSGNRGDDPEELVNHCSLAPLDQPKCLESLPVGGNATVSVFLPTGGTDGTPGGRESTGGADGGVAGDGGAETGGAGATAVGGVGGTGGGATNSGGTGG